MLNDAFTTISAGKVEIDVGPFSALGGKKTLEQQFHPHRINGRDAKRITNDAVCRRATALYKNSLASTELHNVPHD